MWGSSRGERDNLWCRNWDFRIPGLYRVSRFSYISRILGFGVRVYVWGLDLGYGVAGIRDLRFRHLSGETGLRFW